MPRHSTRTRNHDKTGGVARPSGIPLTLPMAGTRLEWYETCWQGEGIQSGDRIFVPCEGGPCISRLETFPPRLEIRERSGTYALDDHGSLPEWRYIFVPDAF